MHQVAVPPPAQRIASPVLRAVIAAMRVLRAVSAWALAGLVLVTMVTWFSAGIATADGMSLSAHDVLIVRSGSMQPVFDTGDAIVIERVSDTRARGDGRIIAPGDIITFESGDAARTLVTHRVVGVSLAADGSPLYATKGDANRLADLSPVPARNVVGVYSFDIPNAGYVLNALQNRRIMPMFLLSVLLGNISIAMFLRAAGPPPDRSRSVDPGTGRPARQQPQQPQQQSPHEQEHTT